MAAKTTFGVIVGNRGFFPDHLVKAGHETIRKTLREAGYGCVILSFQETKFGSVENHEDARKCAELFKANADKIDGIIVTLPNFGDERSAANAIRWSGLTVPVLVQAEPDDVAKMTVENRRDSFCGKISVCNNLRQYGIPYTLTTDHCEGLAGEQFAEDLAQFAATCRVVRAFRNVRFGAIGARTGAFNTVRYSEKILEANGITVETIDLSEVIHAARKFETGDKDLKKKAGQIKAYAECGDVSAEGIDRMARFGLAIDRWVAANNLAGTAIQCWTALEEIYGIVPCSVMSMMSNAGISSACEVDMGGLLAMHALNAASQTPSALVDWNNNYGDDPDKCVLFHCSNFPKDVMSCPKMSYQIIISGSVGKENAYGAMMGRIKSGPTTFARVTTDDNLGLIRAYVGEGLMTDDPIDTFGGYGVLEVPDLQSLMKYICEEGFEHHAAISLSEVSDAIAEAWGTYMGWDVYVHG